MNLNMIFILKKILIIRVVGRKVESNNKIRSLCYDLNSNSLIGTSSYDGQIYQNRSNMNNTFTSWIGPINYDKPMKKVLFSRNNV